MPIAYPDGHGQITWHFTCATGAGDFAVTCGVELLTGSIQEAADLAAASWADNILVKQANMVVFRGTSVRFRVGANMVIADSTGETAVNGTGGADLAPLNSAYLVRKLSAFAGRENKGRMYIPGVVMGDLLANTGATLASGPLTAWQTAVTSLYDELVAGGIPPMILHQEPATTATEVAGFSIQSRLATQRGRLRD